MKRTSVFRRRDFSSGCLCLLLLSFLLVSCARLGLVKKTAAPTEVTEATPGEIAQEAKADAALGAISKKGKTEAEKKEVELLREAEAESALRELRKREREEHEQAVRRRITEDQIIEKQVQT